MKFTRRQLIKSSLAATAGLSLPGSLRGSIPESYVKSEGLADRIPRKGEEFNEAFTFPDEVTRRPITRLSSRRNFNSKATYHIKSGFLGKYIVFSTYNDLEGGSALIRANVENGDLKVLAHTDPGNEFHFRGSGTVVPNTSFYAYTAKDKIILYDIHTLDELEYPLNSGYKKDVGYNFGGAAATCDGKYLLIPYNSNKLDWNDPPEVREKRVGNSLFTLDISNGKMTEVHRDETCRNNHVIANPVDPEWCLIDKDRPPHFYGRSDNGKTPRVCTLHLPSGKVTEIWPNDGCKFAYHSNWNHDGTHVYYHGPSNDKSLRNRIEEAGEEFIDPYGECIPKFNAECNPHFIGVAEMNGKIVWEATFPSMYYGHIGAHTTRDVLFIDSLVTNRYILGFHWRDINKWGTPRTEVVFAHNSIYVDSMQASHPHCTMSDYGKWMSFNAHMHGRSDVYVAEME